MTKHLSKLAGLILLTAVSAFGQGARKDDFIINQAGKPIPNASVTICPTTSTGTPCSPTATVYLDAAETMPITQPILTGPIGNFGFYATPGEYIATVTGSTITSTTIHYSIPCTPSASPAGCGSGGGGTPGGSNGQVQYDNSGAFGGVSGTAVTAGTGAIVFTAGADTTIPIKVNSHSTTQSADLLDLSNQSSGGAGTGTLAAPLLVEGRGFGAFNPNGVTTVVAIQQESTATAATGLIITNRQALGSSSRTSTLEFAVPDNGIAQISGGNAVGDGSGDYGVITFAGNPSIYGASTHAGNMSVAIIENSNADSIVPLTVGNLRSTSTADILDFVNTTSTSPLAFFDKNANLTIPNGTVTTLLTVPTVAVTTALNFTETSAPTPTAGKDICAGVSASHTVQCTFNGGASVSMAQVIAPPLTVGSGTGNVFTAPDGYFVCTAACTVTPPLPTAGVQFCIRNDDNVTSVITLGALGGSGQYERTAWTAYGTAGTGTAVSAGAAGDKLCIVGRDTTHYLVLSFNGTWTMS